MGLITGLLTLPLAPVRGTVWIAERIAEQAEREFDDEARIRRELAELEMRYDLGEIGPDEYEDAAESLLERLMEVTSLEAGGDQRTGGEQVEED